MSVRKLVPIILTVLATGAGVGYCAWSQGAERRALADLPAPERQQLYDRTLENLRFCHEHARQEPLHEYCEQQADLAVRFPDCQGSCRTLARLPWTGPHR